MMKRKYFEVTANSLWTTNVVNQHHARSKPKADTRYLERLMDEDLRRAVIPNLLMHFSLHLFWNFSFLPYGTFNSSPVWIRRLVLTTIGTMALIDGNNLINKIGTKNICCQIMALKQGSQTQIAPRDK